MSLLLRRRDRSVVVIPAPIFPEPPLAGRRDLRQKRRAEAERVTRRRRETELLLVGLP
jgi:hypothetical protein